VAYDADGNGPSMQDIREAMGKKLWIVPISAALTLQNARFRGDACSRAATPSNSLDIRSPMRYTNPYQSPAGG